MADENFFDIAYSLKDTEDTRAMYDRWAAVYDRDLTDGEYQQPARCAAALKAQSVPSDARILDVGCGTGLSGLALRNAGYDNLDGCDLSEGMLEKSKALGVYGRLFQCDLNEPPLDADDETYDALTAVGVFSFGHVTADAVSELLRVTRKQGIVVIGLNDHYYEEGSLTSKIAQLEAAGALELLSAEHGDHIPKNDLKGWVITLRKL